MAMQYQDIYPFLSWIGKKGIGSGRRAFKEVNKWLGPTLYNRSSRRAKCVSLPLGIKLSYPHLFVDLLFDGAANGFAQLFFQLVAAPAAAGLRQDIHLIVGELGNPQLYVAYALLVDEGRIYLVAPGKLDGKGHKQVRVLLVS